MDIVAGLGQIDRVQKSTYSGTNSQSKQWMVNAAKAKITTLLAGLNNITIPPCLLLPFQRPSVYQEEKRPPKGPLFSDSLWVYV